ncbi:hypothetical protein CHUAL_008692 [Chamberlinius hualienensis]
MEMYKMKISKYKNALPKISKKEDWISDINVGSPQSHGNHVKASAAFVAYSSDARGGCSIGVIPLGTNGRIKADTPMVHCHSEQVTDFDFCPFDDGLLVTGSQDCSIKLWRIPEGGLVESLTEPVACLSIQRRRVENVLFHPAAENCLSVSSGQTAAIWDVETQTSVWSYENHSNQISSMGWKEDGSLLATCAKDKMLRILDPRTNTCVKEIINHANSKDGRVVWLGASDRILTTGFDSSLQRQLLLRDLRNFDIPLKSLSSEVSTGVLMPFYDSDTNMLFLVGKGDSSAVFVEPIDFEPFLMEASRYNCGKPIKGACLVPKRGLNVMQCEVNRLLHLSPNCIIPVSYQVPRKSYRMFHDDLFPDTAGPEPAMSCTEWFSGQNQPVPKISLNASATPGKSIVRFKTSFAREYAVEAKEQATDIIFRQTSDSGKYINNATEAARPQTWVKQSISGSQGPVPAPRRRTSSSDSDRLCRSNSLDSSALPPVAAPRSVRKSSKEEYENGSSSGVTGLESRHNSNAKREMVFGSPKAIRVGASNNNEQNVRVGQSPKVFQGFRQSKFRHLHGVPLHRSTHIENIRNLNTSIPGECDGFQVNQDRVALPLRGPGGQIAVLELSKTGRLPDGILPVIQNGASVTDFAWDPFDKCLLAVACDDAKIRLWKIPSQGLTESLTDPHSIIAGHMEKIYFIKFHPLAKNVLASGSYDKSVRIWDLETGEEKIQLSGHTDHIFSLAWSLDGTKIATACRDNKLRIYDPRQSREPIKVGVGPAGNRGARVVWALEDKCLIVTGFDRTSERQVSLYAIDKLNETLTTVGLDVSPAILIPFYDEDSSTVFITGKGDTTVYAYEVCLDTPYLFPLSHHKCNNAHQALAFLPKIICNVKDVEFARAIRLTPTVIEPLSFTVPRVKTEYFQNDIFPDTKVTWEPCNTSSEWFEGKNKKPKFTSLRPEGMKLLVENNGKTKENNTAEVNEIHRSMPFSFSKRKEKDLTSLFATMAIEDGDLPQDSYEGVEAKEWEE